MFNVGNMNILCLESFLTKKIYSFGKKMTSTQGAAQEVEAKFKFAINPAIRNCQIARCTAQTV